MFRSFRINPPVFFGSLAVIFLFLGIAIVLPGEAADILVKVQSWILSRFGW